MLAIVIFVAVVIFIIFVCLGLGCFYYPHFTDVETEVQVVCVTCPKSHDEYVRGTVILILSDTALYSRPFPPSVCRYITWVAC